MVRVGLSQAREAMMIAIWFTVRLPFNETAMMISTSNCGHRQADIGDAADDGVDPAAVIGGGEGQYGADAHADEPGDEADAQCQRRARHHDRQQVAPVAVGAERIVPGGRLQRRRRQRLGIAGIDRQRADDHEHHQDAEQHQPDHQRDVAAKIAEHSA